MRGGAPAGAAGRRRVLGEAEAAMKTLARALINAAAYLELGDESQINPDFALQALEEIAFNLSHCTAEERQALVEVLVDMRAAELDNQTRPEMLAFLDTFLASFGLDGGEAPDSEPPRLNLLYPGE